MTLETAGVVLAGGRSTRMGVDKALAPLAGRPLVAHVAARFAPQVDALFLNANGDAARFASLRCAVVADAAPNAGGGPLAGVAAALRHAQIAGLRHGSRPRHATRRSCRSISSRGSPRRRMKAARRSPSPQPRRGLEPMFALWSTALAREVEAALAAGDGGPRRLIARLGAAQARVRRRRRLRQSQHAGRLRRRGGAAGYVGAQARSPGAVTEPRSDERRRRGETAL